MADRDGFKVRIGDRRYVVDLKSSSWMPTTAYREAIDDGAEPGEQSLNQHGIWRRTRRNFILGAGQEFADEPDESDPLRFWESVGIDNWKERSLRLANRPIEDPNNPGQITSLVKSRDRLYGFTPNSTVVTYITSATADWSLSFNLTANYAENVMTRKHASNGTKVWVALGGGAVDEIVGTTASSFTTTGTANMVAYVNGRLLGCNGRVIKELDSSGNATEVWTHPDTNWQWRDAIEAPNGIYIYGDNFQGSTGEESFSEIYFMGISDVDTSLDVPIVATALGQQEHVTGLAFFGGVILIGTTAGFRMAQISGPGYLTYGPHVKAWDTPQDGSVIYRSSFIADRDGDHIVWFTWRDGDTPRYGVGQIRMDRFTAPLVPRYSYWADHDSSSGLFTQIENFGSKLYMTTVLDGVYYIDKASPTYMTGDAYLRTGWMSYGVSERKAFRQLEIITDPLPAGATVRGKIIQPDGTITTAVTMTTTGQEVGTGTTTIEDEMVDVQIEIVPPNTTTQVVVRRVTLRSIPLPYRASEVTLALVVDSAVEQVEGREARMNILNEWQYLRTLEENRSVVTFEMGGYTTTAYVDGVGFPEGALADWREGETFPAGSILVRLITAEL